jgi:hypothetical protein
MPESPPEKLASSALSVRKLRHASLRLFRVPGGSPADSAKVQRMYVFNGSSRFVERGRNRTFNLLIKSRLELGTQFQTNSLSNQAFAKNQARTQAL